ncbi:MAG: gamma-glutamyl-gamma-aminobutyrate hydrolase family protein [Ruminococcaceae bacterium]|nr:gamma-glutamyl-gamma-aminobutyrate hydrolase family protein [Oscillospiraceae bacterium]
MDKLKLFIFGKKYSIVTFENYQCASEQSDFEVEGDLSPADAAKECDAILFTGGSDLNPKLYGEEITLSEGIDDMRDADEYLYLDAFTKADKPIFGICRGIQLINVYFGGSLYQHIGDNHKDGAHNINIIKNSFIDKAYPEGMRSNSSHHQAVKKLAEGFKISAISDEGIIEAIENPDRNIYATQFHPERMTLKYLSEDYSDGKNYFDFIYNITKNHAENK